MKTKLLLLLLLANFSFYAQTNLVPNPGFENWTGGTLQNWTATNFITKSTDAVEGTSSVNLVYLGASPKIVSTVALKAGVTYAIKYKYKHIGSNYGGSHPIVFKISNDASGTSISSSTFAQNSNWNEKIIDDFTPNADLTFDISFALFNLDSDGYEVLIDDFSIVNVNEPAPQYTLIPDVNFENKLIDYGFDSGVPDGKVLTSNIETVQYLYLNNSSISDLTGIEDFTELEQLIVTNNNLTSLNISKNLILTYLDFGYNNVTEINVSKNTKLTNFYCHGNQITSLDVSQNILLEGFMCHDNKLTAIDVSHNPELGMFDCLDNQIKSIDISKNPKIYELACENNQLINLNLKNGNNTNIALGYTNFKNNPNLTCIMVDDVDYANTNWTELKDATASYSTACTLGLETSVFDKVALYPNPTKGDITIANLSLNKATVYSSTGQLVKSFTLDTANTNNTISLSGLPKGIYYVYLINQDAASAKKVIVE